MQSEGLYGGIEAGGTKFNCIVGNGPDAIEAHTRIPTTTPPETLQRVIDFFRLYTEPRRIAALGIGSFGPVDLDRGSPTYGWITSTPKPGWRNTDMLGSLVDALPIPIILDTDVNVAALGEVTWGAARGIDPALYLTIGTGIGGGLIQRGHPFQGLSHPEMGHIRIPHDRSVDDFTGNCPFHGDCFEGLANGPAIQKRLGQSAANLEDDHPYWTIEAGYIAAALATYILVLSPARIILGGGIMERRFLFPIIRRGVLERLNGYVEVASLLQHIDEYIVPPQLGGQSGVLGAIALARAEFCNPTPRSAHEH